MIEHKASLFNSMKSAFFLWKKHFVKIAIVGLIVYLPTQILIELVSMYFEKTMSYPNPDELRLMNNVYDLIRFLIGSIALLGIIKFSVKILNGEEEQTIGEMLSHGLKKWGKFIVVGFFAGLKVLLYTLLLIIPGIYKSVRLSFIDCVVATNDNIFTDPCDESERLVDKQWWKIFGFLILLFILGFLLELLFVVPLSEYSESRIVLIALAVIMKILKTYFIVVRADYYFNILKAKNGSIASSESCNDQQS